MERLCATRPLKVLNYLRRNMPTDMHSALRELSPRVLSTLHRGPNLHRVIQNPQLRDWLTANPVPVPKASVSDALFRGTLVFVQITYNRPMKAPFSILAADVQTAVNYASLAVDPIHRYASQYGPNSLEVSSNILTFTANLGGDTFTDGDVQGWVDTIVHDNNLTNSCVVILHDAVTTGGPTNNDASGGTLGYHLMTSHGNPYCFCNVFGQNVTVADSNNTYAEVLSHEVAEMTVDPKGNVNNPEVCDACAGNCSNDQFDLFDSSGEFIGGTKSPSTASGFTFFINSIIRPDAYDPDTECAKDGSDLKAVCIYPPPFLTGELLSYGDAGTPGNVSDPMVVGFSDWQEFKFLFGGRNAAGQDRIYAVNQNGQLLSYDDAGTPGNVSDPMVVGFGGWLDFKFLFGGRNSPGEDRIYAVSQNGQLLSYADAGTPGNVSNPMVVGFGGWSAFKFLFGGRNANGQDRIYAVNQNGELLSYEDAGTPGNVSDPMVVGFSAWLDFKFLFGGRNVTGQDRIYAVVP